MICGGSFQAKEDYPVKEDTRNVNGKIEEAIFRAALVVEQRARQMNGNINHIRNSGR